MEAWLTNWGTRLNLPHNHQTASDGKKYGTALMGSGNYVRDQSHVPDSGQLRPAGRLKYSPVTPAQQFLRRLARKWKSRTCISFQEDQILVSTV